MGIKEALQKKIDQIEGKLRFFRNALLALISAIVWSAYAILEKKAGTEIIILSGVGFVVLVFLFIRIKSLEIKEEKFIIELEKEDN